MHKKCNLTLYHFSSSLYQINSEFPIHIWQYIFNIRNEYILFCQKIKPHWQILKVKMCQYGIFFLRTLLIYLQVDMETWNALFIFWGVSTGFSNIKTQHSLWFFECSRGSKHTSISWNYQTGNITAQYWPESRGYCQTKALSLPDPWWYQHCRACRKFLVLDCGVGFWCTRDTTHTVKTGIKNSTFKKSYNIHINLIKFIPYNWIFYLLFEIKFLKFLK